MSNLVLELRQGEVMVINGAPIRFRTKTRIELTAHARFLFGKQIMPPDEADSPARQFYFALQSAYIGTDPERAQGLAAAREIGKRFKAATSSALACEIIDRAIDAAEADECYQALKLARRIIRHEDSVLGRTPAGIAAGPADASAHGPSQPQAHRKPAQDSSPSSAGEAAPLSAKGTNSGRKEVVPCMV